MNSIIDQQLSRAAVYRLLAELWAGELSASSLLLTDSDISDLWRLLGGYCTDELNTQLDDLAEDYCRLFIGPKGHLPPMQSVWVSGELQSSVVSGFIEFAAIADYHSLWAGMLPDHIANELQLMAVILEKAVLETSPEGLDTARELAQAFADQHLGWTERFLEAVGQADDNGFYSSLARVTQSFLSDEQSQYSVDKR